MTPIRLVAIGLVIVIAAAAGVAFARHNEPAARSATLPIVLPTKPGSYVGVYRTGVPHSYAGLTAFTRSTGVRPNVVSYYSGWLEPFQTGFAMTAARNGAVPLVQIEPRGVSLAAIAHGKFDEYLTSYAAAVRAYQRPVILSFGHEPNGRWYSWGYRHTRPATFRAAWRHIVTVFRAAGTTNVTWLWTVNVIYQHSGVRQRSAVRDPAPWWPGRSYVTWVGIDGYYKRSCAFAPLFGPTIKAVRALTHDPILVAETGAAPAAGKPARIADLFAGIRAYGLLGFVWFDAIGVMDWRIDSAAATAAFRRGAQTYKRPS